MVNEFDERFGMRAVKKGFITGDQLISALKTQVSEELQVGEHRYIGAIMVELGFMTQYQVEDILDEMGMMV